MAVTYDNSARTTVGGTVTAVAVCNLTVAANAYLIAVLLNNATTGVSSCAANGTQMTFIDLITNTASGLTGHVYGLTNPPSGNVSISANLVGGVTGSMTIGGASYLGVKVSNPVGTINKGTAGAVATFVISVSTSTTDRAMLFSFGAGNMTATNATTRLYDSTHYAFRLADTAGPSSVISLSASVVAAGNNIGFFGFNLIASVDTVPCYSSLMGVGR